MQSTNVVPIRQESEGKPEDALRRMVEESTDDDTNQRELAKRDRRYYDGQQWTAAEIEVLNKRKQPVMTNNVVRLQIDTLVGITEKNRSDPSALPRNPQDQDAADVATKALVYVDDVQRYDALRTRAVFNLAIEGVCGFEVTAARGRDGIDPVITRLRYEELFWDKYSRDVDFSDASYMGIAKWLHIDKAYQEALPHWDGEPEDLKTMLENSYNTGSTMNHTFDDRPDEWGSSVSKRIRLIYMYYMDGGIWRRTMFCGGGKIYDEASEFVDADGKPANAMILQSCYVDGENARTGIVRDMISPQDGINKRESKLLHMLNNRQTMGQSGAVTDIAKMKRELASPDGHVEYDQDPMSSVPGFAIIPVQDQVVGQFQLLQENKQSLEKRGPNAALSGEMGKSASGRAWQFAQNAGMAQLAPFYAALSDLDLRVYRAVWERIQQYWTAPKWIRITDDNNAPEFVGLNQPVKDQFGFPAMKQVQGEDGQPQLAPVVENNPAEMDMDIVITQSPDYAVLADEQFEQIVKLVSTGQVQLPPEVIIQASSLRGKTGILKMLEDAKEQSGQMQQKQAQLGMAGAEADVMETQASAADKQASAELKAAQARKLGVEAQATAIKTPSDVEKTESAAQLDRARTFDTMRNTP